MVMPLEQQQYLPNNSRSKQAEHPLTVLMLNYEYPPMGGGAGNATRNTALELSRRGHTVHVLTSRMPDQSDVETEGELVVHRVRSRRVSIHQAGLLGAVSFLLGAFLRLRRLAANHDYEIYHFYFGLPTGFLALYTHWVLKKPYVLALRGSDVPGYDNTRTYLRPLHWLLKPITRYIWSHATSVTALSRNLRSLAQSTVSDVRIEVIGNGIDTEMFPAKTRFGTEQGLKLICVCRLEQRKGLNHLLDAMSDLSHHGVTLDIVGKGPREKELFARIERLRLTDAVRLIGYVPSNNLVDYYTAADVFVLPSLSESFGQAMLEAMSSGLPVIASKVGGIPETLDDRAGGLLIEPGSSEAITRAVKELKANRALLKTFGRHNRKKAEQRYSWAGIASQYEVIYRSAVPPQNVAVVREV